MRLIRIVLMSSLAASGNCFNMPKTHPAHTEVKQKERYQDVREVYTSPRISFSTFSTALTASSNASDAEESPSWRIDPFFASLWAVLLGFAVLAPGEIGSPQDNALIEAYIANPTDPVGFNPLFLALFNLLGFIPIIGASIAVPQGSRKGLPSAPFFGLSAAAGYFAAGKLIKSHWNVFIYTSFLTLASHYTCIGIYLTFRAPPRKQVKVSELSWITRNVIENKVFNWLLVGAVISIFFVTGVAPALLQGEFDQLWQSYLDLASNSKFASVSSADAVLYNVALARLVGTDYQLRNPDATDKSANMVGLATLLLPFVGQALYLALRPKLPED